MREALAAARLLSVVFERRHKVRRALPGQGKARSAERREEQADPGREFEQTELDLWIARVIQPGAAFPRELTDLAGETGVALPSEDEAERVMAALQCDGRHLELGEPAARVESAYRAAMQEVHPDHNPGAGARAKRMYQEEQGKERLARAIHHRYLEISP